MNFEWHKFVKFKNYLSLTGSKLTNDFVATHWQKFFYQYPNSIVKKFSICRKRHQNLVTKCQTFSKLWGRTMEIQELLFTCQCRRPRRLYWPKSKAVKSMAWCPSWKSSSNLREVEKWLIKRDTVPFLVKFLFRFRSLSVMLDMIPMLAKVY